MHTCLQPYVGIASLCYPLRNGGSERGKDLPKVIGIEILAGNFIMIAQTGRETLAYIQPQPLCHFFAADSLKARQSFSLFCSVFSPRIHS